ncbi:hypothetical protein JCM19379_07210 [Methyloparacoccus murrellii]
MPTIKALAIIGITLASTAVIASEDQYPAYNFQPSVIFSDASLIQKLSGATASTPSAGGASVQAAAHEPDPKYPAAYFQPSVIYPGN